MIDLALIRNASINKGLGKIGRKAYTTSIHKTNGLESATAKMSVIRNGVVTSVHDVWAITGTADEIRLSNIEIKEQIRPFP